MRINDVLACYNKVLVNKGNILKIPVGHFIAHTTVEKLIGPLKKCSIDIYYIDNKDNMKVCSHSIVDRYTEENKDSLIEKTAIETFTLFLSYWEDESFKKRIIKNEYTNK